MLQILKLHHIAIIVSDYERSKHFYTKLLGLQILQETYRQKRDSYKLDLAIGDTYCIELFSFHSPPKRMNNPEACGLRHIAFAVKSVKETVEDLKKDQIEVETIRIDPLTQKKYTFFRDPDDLPIEIYEN